MKLYADKEKKEVISEVGSVAYKVVQRIGQVAYKLELPKGCQVHPAFHVSQLKNVAGVNNTITTTFP